MGNLKEMIREVLDNYDKSCSYFIFSRAQRIMPRIKPFLYALEWSCNGLLWITVTMILLLLQNEVSLHSKLLIGLIMDIFYIAIFKSLARRRRPTYAYQRDQALVVSVDKHSMPSGHCSRATYLTYFFWHFLSSSSPFITVLVSAWAICVIISRVLLGRHHILDCVAGILLGMFEYYVQFFTFLPINSIGLFLVHQLYGNKSFNDRNDLDGVDPLVD